MKLVSNDDCQKSWGDQLKIKETQLCVKGAEGAAKSACRGDSGGPLMLEVNDTTYAVGVVSMGDDCIPYDPSQKPNVFTNVAAYMEWILNNMVPGNVKDPTDNVRNEVQAPPKGTWSQQDNAPPGSNVWTPIDADGNVIGPPLGSGVWKPIDGAGNGVQGQNWGGGRGPPNGGHYQYQGPPRGWVRWPANNVRYPVQGPPRGGYWGPRPGDRRSVRGPWRGPTNRRYTYEYIVRPVQKF